MCPVFGDALVEDCCVIVAPCRSSRAVNWSADVFRPLSGSRNAIVAVDVGRGPIATGVVGPSSARGRNVAAITIATAAPISPQPAHRGMRSNPVPRSRDKPIHPVQIPANSRIRLKVSSVPAAWARSGVTPQRPLSCDGVR